VEGTVVTWGITLTFARVHSFINGSTALCWALNSSSVSQYYYTDGRTSWMSVHLVARPPQTQNKRTQTFMPWVKFETTTPGFERAKTVNALDRGATVSNWIKPRLTSVMIVSVPYKIQAHRSHYFHVFKNLMPLRSFPKTNYDFETSGNECTTTEIICPCGNWEET
jgi:hypothetical protein